MWFVAVIFFLACERRRISGCHSRKYVCVRRLYFSSLISVLFLSREAVAVSKPSCPVVDVGVVRYTTNEILPQKVQAKPEETEVAQKLIPSLSDAEIEEVRMAM